MIEVRGLCKSYGKLNVLNNINLNFIQSGIYVVLGPNGSGKTTLIKSILGMVLPDKGEIIYNQSVVNNQSDYRQNISYLPQIARFPDNLTGRELITMVKDLRNSDVSELYLIDLFDLDKHLDKNLKNMSGGTKQKINTVIALLFDSPILIFDEPTAGLDPISLIHFKELILKYRSQGKIVIITTHIIDLVEKIADKIIFLLEGEIYFNGSISELLKKHKSSSLENAIANILENNKNV